MRRDMLLLAAFLMAPPTLAQQQPDYQIHGFAAQGFVLTSDNNLFGDSEDGSLDFHELGINGQWQPLDRLAFSGQLLSRRAGEADDGDPVIDFLFADLNLFQGNRGGAMGVRVGRVKNPYGFFNETRDVLFTRPSVLLPQSIYLDSGGLRTLVFSMDGVQAYGHFSHGAHYTQLTLNHAIDYSLSSEEKETLFGGAAPPIDVEVSRFHIARAMTDWYSGQLRTGITFLQARLDFTPGFPTDQQLEVDLYILSARWNAPRFSVFGEYSQVNLDTSKSDGGYVQAEYRATNNITGFARYDVRFNNRNDRSGGEFERTTGLPAESQYARDSTVGLRWDLNSHWGLSAEWHYIDGTASVPPLDNQGQSPEGPWHAFLTMVGYRF